MAKATVVWERRTEQGRYYAVIRSARTGRPMVHGGAAVETHRVGFSDAVPGLVARLADAYGWTVAGEHGGRS